MYIANLWKQGLQCKTLYINREILHNTLKTPLENLEVAA